MNGIGLVAIPIDIAVQCGLKDEVSCGTVTVEVQRQQTLVEAVGVVTVLVGIQADLHLGHQVNLITIGIQVHTARNVTAALGGQGQGANERLAITGADAAGDDQVFAGNQLQATPGGQGGIQNGQRATGFQNQGVRTQGAGQAFSDRAFGHGAVATGIGGDHRHAKRELAARAVLHPFFGVDELVKLNILGRNQRDATVVKQ